MNSFLSDGAYKRTLAANQKESLAMQEAVVVSGQFFKT